MPETRNPKRVRPHAPTMALEVQPGNVADVADIFGGADVLYSPSDHEKPVWDMTVYPPDKKHEIMIGRGDWVIYGGDLSEPRVLTDEEFRKEYSTN